jgi:hypothetical protein
VLTGFTVNGRLLTAKTARLLTIQPKVEIDGPASFDGDVEMAGPTTSLRASVEPGEATFEDDGPTITREEHDG